MWADNIGKRDHVVERREVRECAGRRCETRKGGKGLDGEYVELGTGDIRVLDELAASYFTDDL